MQTVDLDTELDTPAQIELVDHIVDVAQISPAGEYARDHDGFCANENEYSSDGTSHAAPGYVLSRQVPPTRSSRSTMTKSSTPASVSLIAAPMPVKPVPTISVS